MHTEMSETRPRSGCIFYDAECPFCRGAMKRVGGLFTRRGFEWVPLQTPGLAGWLQIPEAALGEEMKLQLADGRVIGGIDTWGHLLRSIGWLWPLGFALSLPGIHFVSQIC